MIATQDIADYAAERLLSLGFSGRTVRELLGQRDVTPAEAARVFGAAIGKPDLNYVPFPYEKAEKTMIQRGFSTDAAKQMAELQRSLNEGIVKPAESRSAENTTPTSIEEFSKVFASAYVAASSQKQLAAV